MMWVYLLDYHMSKLKIFQSIIYIYHFSTFNMSHVMRKSTFCKCENKDADQLRGNFPKYNIHISLFNI